MSGTPIPKARAVRGGRSTGRKALTSADVADDNPGMIAGSLRALKREMHSGFESIAQALQAFKGIDAKLDVIIDRQNVIERRVSELERRVSELETRAEPP